MKLIPFSQKKLIFDRTYLTVGVGALAGLALFVLFAASTQQVASKKKTEQKPFEDYTDEELSYLLTTYTDSPVLPQPLTRYQRSTSNGNCFYLHHYFNLHVCLSFCLSVFAPISVSISVHLLKVRVNRKLGSFNLPNGALLANLSTGNSKVHS